MTDPAAQERPDWRIGMLTGLRSSGAMAAIRGAGGVRALARKIGQPRSTVGGWYEVPASLLFEVAEASGVDAEVIRPDLAEWIPIERHRRWMEKARARFALRSKTLGGEAHLKAEGGQVRDMTLLDLGLIAMAMRFAAEERGLAVRAVIGAPIGGAGGGAGGGGGSAEQKARAYAMGLAVVAGRVSAQAVADFIGCSRQGVDAAAGRYLRSRDGDDAEDVIDGRVMERGKSRPARTRDEALWEAERRFATVLAGEGGE